MGSGRETSVETTSLRLFEHMDRMREPQAVGRGWTPRRGVSLRTLPASQREHLTETERLWLEPVAFVTEQRLDG
jgi:hypothetical protein